MTLKQWHELGWINTARAKFAFHAHRAGAMADKRTKRKPGTSYEVPSAAAIGTAHERFGGFLAARSRSE